MYIEVWQAGSSLWYWHFRATNGKVTADAESFPSKAHAIRAAKAVVRGVRKPIFAGDVKFTTTERDGVTRIDWA